MVCVYGMSHVPALLLLSFPGFEGKSAFLVFFLVFVVQPAWWCSTDRAHFTCRRPKAAQRPLVTRPPSRRT
jgi:phosphatidate cytidylyltransferase